MKVFAAFQSVAFFLPHYHNNNLYSQQQKQQQNQQIQSSLTPSYHLSPLYNSANDNNRKNLDDTFFTRRTSYNETSNSNSNNNTTNNTTMSAASAVATMEVPPLETIQQPQEQPQEQEQPQNSHKLLSKILPPLPEGSRRLYLLRHGETDWNTLGKIQGGGYDIPLNENGRKQAWTTAHELDDIPLDVIASSHLSRAKETADILWELHKNTKTDNNTNTDNNVDTNSQQQQPPPQSTTTTTTSPHRIIHKGFGEMSFGEFEGLASRDEELDPSKKERFITISKQLKTDLTMAYPGGGESTIQVEERSKNALFQILFNDYPNAKHIAVVSHGRTNKVLLASVVLGDVSKFTQVRQSNTCINVADVDAEGNWTVQTINYIEHVKDNVIIRLPS